jgi:hypothetical protein
MAAFADRPAAQEMLKTPSNRIQIGAFLIPMLSKLVKRNLVFYCAGLLLIWAPANSLSEEAAAVTHTRAVNPDRPGYDEALITRLQRALRHRGYYGGRINGFLDQQTQEAIARFEVDDGVAVRAVLDRSLLVSLGLIRRHKALRSKKAASGAEKLVLKPHAART